MKGKPRQYVITLQGETAQFPADVYRVVVETGVLLLYERRPKVVIPGDSDALLEAYGAG